MVVNVSPTPSRDDWCKQALGFCFHLPGSQAVLYEGSSTYTQGTGSSERLLARFSKALAYTLFFFHGLQSSRDNIHTLHPRLGASFSFIRQGRKNEAKGTTSEGDDCEISEHSSRSKAFNHVCYAMLTGFERMQFSCPGVKVFQFRTQKGQRNRAHATYHVNEVRSGSGKKSMNISQNGVCLPHVVMNEERRPSAVLELWR